MSDPVLITVIICATVLLVIGGLIVDNSFANWVNRRHR